MIDLPFVRAGVPLAPMTTYKVGGEARWFCEPGDLEELRTVLKAKPDDVPVVLLGRGSNVVVSDSGIDGLVIKLGGSFSALDLDRDGLAVAGGALALPKLARSAAAAGKSGLGFFVGIPGSVGGAVRMNAGGHGSDTASVLVDAVVVDVRTGSVEKKPAEELGLSYRTSNLSNHDLVVQATFVATAGDVSQLESELRDITRWRKRHQPGGTLNAGSVFKNPETQAAGAIIDECGLKGFAVGSVRISPVHANFLEASAEASASDIHALVDSVRDTVRRMTGITLEPEIRFLGSFEEDSE